MRSTFNLWIVAALFVAPLAYSQDKETDEQIKQATEAAKKMGLKMPDLKELAEESDQEAKEEAAEQSAAKPEPSANKVSSPAPVTVDLPTGSAKGSITYDGQTAALKFASGFVDQKDERKPVVLLLSDQKLPTEKWTSEFDMMMDHAKWSGVVFFLDKEGTIYRTDVHTKGRQASVSGIFDVKIDQPASKDLAGRARTSEGAKEEKLDVTFHAIVK